MTKTKNLIRILIPLMIIAALLVYCWTIILTTELLATWRHYVGLLFFIGLLFLFLKNVALATVATGVYLLLATVNVLAITGRITTNWVGFGSVTTPPFQLLSFGLFIFFSYYLS